MLDTNRPKRRPAPEIKILQRKALFAAYRDVCSKPCPSQAIAWHRTVNHAAPRFYITDKYATEIFYELARGDYDRYNRLPKLRQKMIDEIYNIIIRLSQKREFHGQSLKFIVSFAIRQPASQFFITTESFRKIFRYSKRYGIDYNRNDFQESISKFSNFKNDVPSTAKYDGSLNPITAFL